MLDALKSIQAATYLASNDTPQFNVSLNVKPPSYCHLKCMLNEKQKITSNTALLGKYECLQLTHNEEYLGLVSSVLAKLTSWAIQPDSGLNPLNYALPLIPF
jgi:hypothetical protein